MRQKLSLNTKLKLFYFLNVLPHVLGHKIHYMTNFNCNYNEMF